MIDRALYETYSDDELRKWALYWEAALEVGSGLGGDRIGLVEEIDLLIEIADERAQKKEQDGAADIGERREDV